MRASINIISRKLQDVMTHFCDITMAVICYCFICAIPAQAQDSNFFNERYRGWLWFEEGREEARKQLQESEDQELITPIDAKAEIDKLAKEFDDAKYVMLARPTAQNIKSYMEKEAVIWKNIERLQKAWEVAAFLYPEHNDLIKEPVNVHAVKLRREMDDMQQAEAIKDFAREFDLVLFFKGNCKFCAAFEPVLKNFAEGFGFKIEAITMDGTKSEHFVTANLPKLVKQLGIEAAPTLVAVSKDGKTAFELVRGFLSLTELEQHSARAANYLASQGMMQKSTDVERKMNRKRARNNDAKRADLLTQDKIKKLKK